MKINHLLIMILVLVCTARVYAGVAVTNHTESPQSKDQIEIQWAVWWGSVPEFVCYWGAVPTRYDNITPYFCQEPETFTCGIGDDAVPCNDAVDGFSGQVTGSYTFNPEYWPDGVELGAHTFRVSVCTPEAVTVDTVISPNDSDINPKVALCGDNTYYTIDQDITITDALMVMLGDLELSNQISADQVTITQLEKSGSVRAKIILFKN